METTQEPLDDRPSLESLVEAGLLELDSLHPGGLDLTRELAGLCNIRRGARVLDVASGTGETACFLAETFGARVCGVDYSDRMIQRATAKAHAKGLEVEFTKADAANLPFADAEFDAVICECTLCLLEKTRVLREMARVIRPAGCIGIHDLCWKEGATDDLRRTLAENEGERPETLEGWQRLFGDTGLVQIKAIDRSTVMLRWIQASKRRLGLKGQMVLALRVVRRWGFGGLWTVLQSERVFSSKLLGYGIIVGMKP